MLILRRTSELTLRAVGYSTATSRLYSKDYASSSDDEKGPKKQKETKGKTDPPNEETAAERLNRLLSSMETDNKSFEISMARPGEGTRKRRDAAKQEVASKDVVAAAKSIASMLGEKNDEIKKQTESELLGKLLGHNLNDTEKAKPQNNTELNLSDLIVGMKIDRTQQPKDETRGEYVRRTLLTRTKKQSLDQNQQNKFRRRHIKREAESYTGSVNLFGGKPLGIFKQPEALLESPDILSTWAQLEERELKLQVTHPPTNYFEKVARWTEQGKVWCFPINNEQDMTEEANVDFSEHIFLEQHLEPWCPTKGPIRHFMELVCVGLSKNPYITAQDKKEHILWYRDYFESKKDILKDLMSKEKMEKFTATEQLE